MQRQDYMQAFFNFLSVSAVAMAVSNSGGDAVLQTVQVMVAHFVILPLTICSGAEVSGAHFNPVVTACFVLVGKIVSYSSFPSETADLRLQFQRRRESVS